MGDTGYLQEQLPCMDDTAAAIAAGMRIGELESFTINDIDGIPHALIPKGMALESFEELSPAPRRLTYERSFDETESFCAFTESMGVKENGRLYGDWATGIISAIMDDVNVGRPSWQDRKAVLKLVESPEMKVWREAQSAPLSHVNFVEFLESMIHTIAAPNGAEISAAYRAFHASQNVKVTQVIDEGGNLQVNMEEEVRGTTKTPSGHIPSRLKLILRPFGMGRQYEVAAIVNFRLREGAVTFHVKLLRLPEIIEEAFNDVRIRVEGLLGMKVLF